jgi:hypothetical protein
MIKNFKSFINSERKKSVTNESYTELSDYELKDVFDEVEEIDDDDVDDDSEDNDIDDKEKTE